MGGSRCTYRNCSVRSDGVVHMFHYPVYDKIRCHKWLINAHRLDFLNLKLSQVRNRVVCQHHFKNECFMNFRKEKLTYNAIPTEDGPFCEKTNDNALPVEHMVKTYSISISNLDEHDLYSKENSKANSSMIYADFLTNGDAWEKQSLNETIWNNIVITSKDKPTKNAPKISWQRKNEGKEQRQETSITLTDIIEDVNTTRITEFENPLLANMSPNASKTYADQKGMKSNKKSKNSQRSCKIKTNSDIIGLEKEEKQEKTFTLTDIENVNSTKITELVIPVLGNTSSNPSKTNVNQKGMISNKQNKKDQNFRNIQINAEFIRLDTKQEPSNTVVNYKSDFILPDQNLDNLLGNQENNNMIIDYNNYAGPFNNTSEKKIEIDIPNEVETPTVATQTLQKNKMEQLPEFVTTMNDYCAIIENPNDIVKEIQKPEQHFNADKWKNDDLNKSDTVISPRKPKITILSEKTISEPVLVKGYLAPFLPSSDILCLQKSKSKSFNDAQIKNENNQVSALKLDENIPTVILENKNDINDSKGTDNTIISKVTDNKNIFKKTNNKNISKDKEIINKKSSEVLSKPPVIKHKITPERVAAIEKKRSFNKKLRDIIEICLNKLDDPEKTSEDIKVADTPKVSHLKEKANILKQHVGTYLSKHEELPSAQEYVMTFLEARMKKMEDALLHKIDQNSQRIVELKNSISQPPQRRKAAATQTTTNEESYKKYLFQEISKFISPNASSSIYEELFINKYVENIPNQPPSSKKRKYR